MIVKNYKGLELTAKHNTLSVLIDDFKQGGGKATLLSIYVFLKENRNDRDLFLKFLNLIPDYILVRVCKLSAEVGDGEFQLVVTVQYNHAVVGSVYNVYVLLIVHENIAGIIDGGIKTHVLGVYDQRGNVSIRGVQGKSVNGVGIRLIGLVGTDRNGEHHNEYKN